MMADGRITPASMVTHIGGLSCVPETTLRLPAIPGGKKLIYTHADLPLTAIADFARLGSVTRCSRRWRARWRWAAACGTTRRSRFFLTHIGSGRTEKTGFKPHVNYAVCTV